MNTYQRIVLITALPITEVLDKDVVCESRVFPMGFHWMGEHRPSVGDLLVKNGAVFYVIPASELCHYELVDEAPAPVAPVPPSRWHLKSQTNEFLATLGEPLTPDSREAMVFDSAHSALDFVTQHQLPGFSPVENLLDPVDSLQ